MSVTVNNASLLTTASNTVVLAGQTKASVSFSFRINDATPLKANWYGYTPLQRGSQQGFAFLVYDVDEVNKKFTLRFLWRTAGGGCDAFATISPNIVYSFVLGYDANDANGRILYSNGVPTLMNTPQTTPTISTPQSILMGSTGASWGRVSWSLENLMFWNGYIPTASEVRDIMHGAADPTTIGLSATWRGWYQFNGTNGTNVKAGDATLGNSIDGSWPFAPNVNANVAGSSILYDAPMPFVSQTGFYTPLVTSSGKAVQVLAKMNTSGQAITVTAGSATIMPTIRINGGPPITLERPFYSGAHEGILYFLPLGSKVDAGDRVTFSADSGWFSTNLGVVDAAVDVPCINKADRPKYGDDPVTSRVGLNYTYPPSTYWGFYQGPRNWALRLQNDNSSANPPALRANGTFAVNVTGSRLTETNANNPIDKTTTPQQYGKWVASWDDKDPDNPTTVMLYGDSVGTATELMEYRNNGDANGVGKARVWDYQYTSYSYTLPNSINASATTFALSSVTGLDGQLKAWIKIDDEYMDVVSVNTGAKQVTVNRGTNGTTAASHASGATVAGKWYRRNISVFVSITAPNGAPNYDNLVINSPSDWTPPVPAAPVVLNRDPEFQRGPSQFVLDSMAGGLGVTRHMDAAGTYFHFSEVEHARRDDDPYWNYYYDYKYRYRIKSWEPMAPATTPWVYTHSDDGAQTYTVTLLSPIVTAPARDTVETIQIAVDPDNPVMSGTRVKIDDEWLYIRDVNGTACEVVRGARNTIPATHAAGPMTAGWRIPITSTTQYENPALVALVATTDVQHKIRTGMPLGLPKSIDMNPLARSTVTLTQDFAAGGKTFKISADPAFWPYITTDLIITFEPGTPNAESVAVITADQSTGTVTCRYGTSKTHLSGATGATSSCGVFCVSGDGTTSGWTLSNVSGTAFVVGPNKYMIALETYFSNGQYPAPVLSGASQAWDESPQIVGGLDVGQVAVNFPSAVCSWEYTARATRQCPGAIHWMNINLTASDDLVDHIARSVRDELPAGKHQVVVELGNEVWNALITFYKPTMRYSQMLGYYTGTGTSWMDRWVLRTKAVTERVRAIFAEQGRGAEVLLSLPWQTAALGDALARARACGVDVDVASAAYYISPGNTQAHIDAFNLSSADQCADIWIFDLEFYRGGSGARMRTDAAALALHRSLTGNRPIQYLCYEGGVASSIAIPPNGINDATKYPYGLQKQLDVLYHPNWYNADRDLYRVYKKTGDIDGIALFTHCQTAAYIPQGSGSAAQMWGLTAWHGQAAGRGDGSDGKADNRLCLAEPGHANSKSPFVNLDEQNVSVRLQSVIDHNVAYYAQLNGGSPGTGPGTNPNPTTTQQKALKLPPRSRYRNP